MPKHTPGPWWTKDGEAEVRIESERITIALIPIDDGLTPESEDRANARLIAAAPEMYALLKRLVDAYPGNKAAMLGNGVAFQVTLDAAAVVAKAEGRK